MGQDQTLTTAPAQARQPGVTGKPRVGIAFQGGSFLGGSIAGGTVRGLAEGGAFEAYDISVFSGISSGALVATVCWGRALQGKFSEVPHVLQEQWLHNALNIIPTEKAGNAALMMDELLSANPVYSLGFPRSLGYPGWKEGFLTPWLRWEFQRWVELYIKPEECMQWLYDNHIKAAVSPLLSGKVDKIERNAVLRRLPETYASCEKCPRLVIGAADILRGENAEFTDTDFFSFLCDELTETGDVAQSVTRAAERMVECVMASGSLDELNGITPIKPRSYAPRDISGYYLDGGWSENPPISALTDYSVDQIWLVEVFPKERAKLPETHEQRADRREELWQNSGVEQQISFINKLNLWIESGRLINDDSRLKALQGQLKASLDGSRADRTELTEAWRAANGDADDKDSDYLAANMTRPYRHITVRRISLPEEMQQLTHGARIVNARSFISDMLEFGRHNALHFRSTLIP